MRPAQIDTPSGPAQAHLHPARQPKGALVLGHGAGGGVEAVDLVAASEAAVEAGFTVALVEQPYRVAGRRSRPRRSGSTKLGLRSSSTCGARSWLTCR